MCSEPTQERLSFLRTQIKFWLARPILEKHANTLLLFEYPAQREIANSQLRRDLAIISPWLDWKYNFDWALSWKWELCKHH